MANFGLPASETGTDEELLVILRERYAHVIAHGWYRAQNGRIVQDVKPAEIRREIEAVESRLNADSGGAVNYAKRMRAS